WRVLPAIALIFLTGLADDLKGLRPWQKLAGQMAAAAAACAAARCATRSACATRMAGTCASAMPPPDSSTCAPSRNWRGRGCASSWRPTAVTSSSTGARCATRARGRGRGCAPSSR
ncbi:hypothetical protein EO238_24395, partial [Citrobacter sp. AAK_AS5]